MINYKQALLENKEAEDELKRQLASYSQHMKDESERWADVPKPTKYSYDDNTPVGTPEQELNTLKAQISDFIKHNKEVADQVGGPSSAPRNQMAAIEDPIPNGTPDQYMNLLKNQVGDYINRNKEMDEEQPSKFAKLRSLINPI
jgi:hypothetical protein